MTLARDAAAAASKQLDLIHGAGRSTRMEIQFADINLNKKSVIHSVMYWMKKLLLFLSLSEARAANSTISHALLLAFL
jgi:hypothetical protein